jgi:KRAB domain-containing zinc finger protein
MYGGKRPFQCPSCNAALLNPQHQHNCYNFQGKVEIDSEGFFLCQLCSNKYKSSESFERHIQTKHSEARPFTCTQCDFSTKTSMVLKNHVRRVHEKERKYVCPECGKAFFSSYQLKLHLDTKEKRKREICSNEEGNNK